MELGTLSKLTKQALLSNALGFANTAHSTLEKQWNYNRNLALRQVKHQTKKALILYMSFQWELKLEETGTAFLRQQHKYHTSD